MLLALMFSSLLDSFVLVSAVTQEARYLKGETKLDAESKSYSERYEKLLRKMNEETQQLRKEQKEVKESLGSNSKQREEFAAVLKLLQVPSLSLCLSRLTLTFDWLFRPMQMKMKITQQQVRIDREENKDHNILRLDGEDEQNAVEMDNMNGVPPASSPSPVIAAAAAASGSPSSPPAAPPISMAAGVPSMPSNAALPPMPSSSTPPPPRAVPVPVAPV